MTSRLPTTNAMQELLVSLNWVVLQHIVQNKTIFFHISKFQTYDDARDKFYLFIKTTKLYQTLIPYITYLFKYWSNKIYKINYATDRYCDLYLAFFKCLWFTLDDVGEMIFYFLKMTMEEALLT